MSRGEREVEETLPAGERADAKQAGGEPTRSLGVSRPRRYGLASRMEKAQVLAALFDEPVEEVRVGRFVLREYVGGGGMGEVYAAWDEKAQRKVALKMVRADHATSARPNDRLLREAQVLAQLSDPNVVHLYEVDEIDGRVFLAMELVHGRSLRRWLNELDASGGRARVREVLRRFVAAGRGLKAAHEAGLVHRDFKPDNVLVGDDGRVRVVDFGLARPVARLVSAAAPDRSAAAGDTRWDGETLPSDGPDRGPGGGSDAGRRPQPRTADRVLTSHGQILGTVPYMSPEQLRGAEADHRSDQFSFCVALYEALYGEPPFAGASFSARQQAIERGLPEPPRGSAVPAPVRKAIQRGLAADPAARFPDMGALLDVLERWLRPSSLARAVAAAVLGTAVAGCTLLFVFRPDPCSEAGAEVAELWAPARRDAIREAFKGTGLSYAAASFSTLEHGLGNYARRLEEDVVSSCEATRVQETQSPELMDLRALCLDSRQRRLDALLEQLEHADASMVERAHAAAAELPDLATCQHAGTLLHGMPRPAPEIENQVAEIRDHLAQARTQELLGKRDEALRIARAGLEQAESLSYGPVQAEALYQTGRVLVYGATSKERDEGEAMLLRAANLGESERHDELVAETWNYLALSADRNHSSTEQARQWQARADTAIRRVGDPPLYRAAALRSLALAYLKEGKLAKAETEQRKALAVLESAPGASRLNPPAYQHDLAIIVQRLGRHQEAREIYDQALALYIAELGETHPYVANLRFDMAKLYAAQGAFAEARQLFLHVLRAYVETLGEDHPRVGNTHLELAEVERHSGALARALDHVQRAIGIYERAHGSEHAQLALAYTCLGAIEFRRGAHEKALTAYEKALTIHTRHQARLDVGLDQMNIAETKLALERHDEVLTALEEAEAIVQPYLADIPTLAPFLASVHGRVLLGKGELEAAVVALESAVQGLDARSMPVERADAAWALVQALSKSGRANDPRALDLARDALAVYELQGPEVITPRPAVQRWLAAHGNR